MIEAIVRSYAEDPRRFYSLMTAVLRPNEYELIGFGQDFGQFLDAIAGPSPVLAVVETVQAFRDIRQRRAKPAGAGCVAPRIGELRICPLPRFSLRARQPGFATRGRHRRPTSFCAKRSGLGEARNCVWGFKLNSRALAFRLSQDDGIDQIMAAAGLPVPSDNVSSWRFNAIYGLLWARGAADPARRPRSLLTLSSRCQSRSVC